MTGQVSAGEGRGVTDGAGEGRGVTDGEISEGQMFICATSHSLRIIRALCELCNFDPGNESVHVAYFRRETALALCVCVLSLIHI